MDPMAEGVSPQRGWYVAAALPFVIGCIVCAFLIVRAVQEMSEIGASMPHIVVPGKAVLSLAPGAYTIFNEYQSVVDDRVYANAPEAISGIRVEITKERSSAPVPVSSSSANLSYSLGSRAGKSIMDFEITEPGRYEIAADFPESPGGEGRFVLAIGQGMGKEIFRSVTMIFGIIGIFFVSLILSAGAGVMVFLKRQRTMQGSLEPPPA